MAPRRAGKQAEKVLDPDDPLVFMMPTPLSQGISGSPEIESQDTRLVIDTQNVIGSAGVYRAELVYVDGHSESCVAVRRRTSVAFETFQILNACSHQNIAKPIGVWEDKQNERGYIVFQNFDGVLSSVLKKDIFEVDNPLEPNPSICGFSKIGFSIFSDVISAVNYVNDQYQQERTQTENYIPLKSLRIEAGTIFYQLKGDKDYLVLLSDFEMATGGSSQNVKGKGRRRNKGKTNAGNSGEEPDVHKIRIRNWNNLGNYIAQLYGSWNANFEVTHLVGTLKKEAVNYEDLVWEAGLWDLSTKAYFIREIFWCYDKNKSRIGDLYSRGALGLQSCIDKFGVKETIFIGGEEIKQIIKDDSLFKSLIFLRVFILAHQADVLKGHGDQDDYQDQKSAERFVLKEKGDYMVKLIEEIRTLYWIKTSPYLRSRHDYMIERHRPQDK